MAKQEASYSIGRIGNVIYYRYKGKGYSRIAPSDVRQTKATKESAKDFGRAVQISRRLRFLLSPALRNYKEKNVMYAMNRALFTWLRKPKSIKENGRLVGLEFNEKSNFATRFKQSPVVDFNQTGKIIINIPELKIPEDLAAPSPTKSIRLDIAAAGCMLSEFQPAGNAATSIEFPYDDGLVPAVQKELDFDCKPGTINVVAISLHYFTNDHGYMERVTDERWTPASIIAVMAPE